MDEGLEMKNCDIQFWGSKGRVEESRHWTHFTPDSLSSAALYKIKWPHQELGGSSESGNSKVFEPKRAPNKIVRNPKPLKFHK